MTTALVTLMFFALAGSAAARALCLQPAATRAGRLAFAFLTGVIVAGTTMYVLALIGVPITRATLAIFSGACGVMLLLRRPATTPAGRGTHPAAATWLLALPFAVWLVSAAIVPVRDYDGRVTWLPKARAVFHEGSLDAPYFHGTGGLNLHNQYPLLLPLDAASMMIITGDDSNEAARFLPPMIAIAALLVIRDLIAAMFPRSAAWIIAAVAWLPVFMRIEGGALAAYNDIAVMAFVAVALAQLLRENGDATAAALFLAGLILTKNEGGVLAMAVIAAAVATRRAALRNSWWKVATGVTSGLLILAWWRASVPPAYDERYDVLIQSLPQLLHRAPEALLALARHAIEPRIWGLLWPAVAFAFFLRRARIAIFAPALMIVLAVGVYVSALTVTSWNINELATVAADRLLMHILGPACTILAAAVEPYRHAGRIDGIYAAA